MESLTVFNALHPIDALVQKAIQRVARRRTLPKGAILLCEGQITSEVHFIEEGLVRAFHYKDKRDITSWVANEGRFIWPLPSYLLRQPSRDNIQLLEPTTVLSLTRQDVEQLKQECDGFDNLRCRIMERYIILYDLRVQILLLKAEERIETYQRMFPELYKRVPLCHIATYLGIDPATLSRLRGAYKTRKEIVIS